ncbi:MAG: flagellar motor switch protein FliN [Variovorax sp.]
MSTEQTEALAASSETFAADAAAAPPAQAAEWAEALQANPNGPLSAAAAVPQSRGVLHDINRVLDIPVQLSVELGRKKVSIKHVLQLGQGSIIELDALAGEPMDVLVNGFLVAQGEVVVVNNKFGIRLTDVVTPSERLRRVNRG